MEGRASRPGRPMSWTAGEGSAGEANVRGGGGGRGGGGLPGLEGGRGGRGDGGHMPGRRAVAPAGEGVGRVGGGRAVGRGGGLRGRGGAAGAVAHGPTVCLHTVRVQVREGRGPQGLGPRGDAYMPARTAACVRPRWRGGRRGGWDEGPSQGQPTASARRPYVYGVRREAAGDRRGRGRGPGSPFGQGQAPIPLPLPLPMREGAGTSAGPPPSFIGSASAMPSTHRHYPSLTHDRKPPSPGPAPGPKAARP